MSNTRLPLRKCVSCNEMKEKNELFRIVRVGKDVMLDKTYKVDGRGAYVCKDRACIDLAIKKKSFNRGLKCPVDIEVLNSLYLELEDGSR